MDDTDTLETEPVISDEAPDEDKAEVAEQEQEVEEVEEQDSTDEDQDEPDEDSEEEETVEYVEVEYDGEKYELPPQLKDALLRQSDYTKKTQEVAESRKAFEIEQQAFQQRVQLQQQHLEGYAQVAALDQQIAQFDGINWQAAIDEDPVEAMKLNQRLTDLKDAKSQAETQLNESQQKALADQQEHLAKAAEKGREVLANEIEGWSPEMAKSLYSYAVESGIPEQQAASVVDPAQVKLLHKAFMFDQLQKKAQQKPKPKPVKPITKVKGKNPVSKDLIKDADNMSADEWVKRRNSQIAKRA